MNSLDRTALAALGAVLAYVAFQWGGAVRTGRYEYLLLLGLLGMILSLRAREQWAPLPGNFVRWALALLPAYVFMQVVPLPVSLVRVLSPARAQAVAALDLIGAKVNFASLSVSPAATFQSFLLVCGYLIIFLLVRELTWRFDDSCWLLIWPILGIAALEAGLGLWQYFGERGSKSHGERTPTITTTRASWRWRCRLRWCTPWCFCAALAREGTRRWLLRWRLAACGHWRV